ncbi:beta-1,2-xylosyltransferase RCN11-like isoform X1 [Zingiber officinale]|uniref:Glycosyltransferase 61 catalytic domain-containing protein n=1 Tax=Zingiber officinale TaxID=94328 RepID=A0A8J5KTU9_ZINOF|nr:beta-1,2-xylosyltransferase RCN11-like isoform X1 [Zingiber officinale]KAG6495354.1 hypothetical protein ZIOFF_043157 [Zingiber officinale]
MTLRQRRLLLRTLLFLFSLNAATIAFYLLFHFPQRSPAVDAAISTQTLDKDRQQYPTLKQWPTLPSFLPWIPSPGPPLSSCEAYFGHGFSRRIDALGAGEDGGGWLRCHYSETLRSSVCEGAQIRMDPSRIIMSDGGESLEVVIGRGEEEELPKYESGAFEIDGGSLGKEGMRAVDEEFLEKYVQRGEVQSHTMRMLMESMRFVGHQKLDCSEWIEEPTVLVTRFEYANVFHTVTDWYSAYVSSRVTDLPYRPNLVFVDGHCKTQLEETWEAIFSSVRYAKNFSGPVCFRHAVFAPLGYETALFKGLTQHINCQGISAGKLRQDPDIHRTARLSEFGEMIITAFGLLGKRDLPRDPSVGYNVLFVRREDYLAHPRHSGKVESRLSNEQEVFDAIKIWAARQDKCRINVVNGLFAHMHMKEQLEAIQEASVVVGAHGAGLTHLVAAREGTKVLEIISSMYRRPHFALISEWKGLEYHPIYLSGSYAVPAKVIDELSHIMGSIGC